MKNYMFFDQKIECEFELPGLVPHKITNVSSCLSIFLGSVEHSEVEPDQWRHHWKNQNGKITLSLSLANNSYTLHVPGLVSFKLDADGDHVMCFPQPSVSEDIVGHFLVAQILPRIFAHFHDYPVLHASCVTDEDGCWCFLGDTGCGKSTLAAAFAQQGYTVLTDDCLSISTEPGCVRCTPSYSGIRLLPDSFKRLGYSEKLSFFLHEPSGKVQVLSQKKPSLSVPVKALFFLSPPAENEGKSVVEVKALSKSEAMKMVLANSFSLDVYDTFYLERQFFQIAGVLSTGIPVFNLTFPRKYNKLQEVVFEVLQTVNILSDGFTMR